MILGLVAAAVLGVPADGYKLQDFQLLGSDGRHYNLKSLTAGKPVLIFYLRSKIKALVVKGDRIEKYRLDGFEPYRQRDLERLALMTQRKLRVCAFTLTESDADIRFQARLTKCKFLLLGSDHKVSEYSVLGLVQQILVGYQGRDLHHLQNALIMPDRNLRGGLAGLQSGLPGADAAHRHQARRPQALPRSLPVPA